VICSGEAILLAGRRPLTLLHAAAVAAVATIAVRLALVSYLEVTTIPNIRSFRYISLAAPFVILFIGVAAALFACRLADFLAKRP
jgi:hypothetical protein